MVLSKNESITDFYIDAAIDGTHKGVFKKDTPNNWHRKHKQHHSTYYNDHMQSGDDFRNRKVFSNHAITTTTITTTTTSTSIPNIATATSTTSSSVVNESTVSQPMKRIRVDESGILIPNRNSEVVPASNVISSKLANSNSSSIRRNKRFKMTNHIGDHCNQDYWNENVFADRMTQFSRRWSYTKTDLKNKTVSFRLVLFAIVFLSQQMNRPVFGPKKKLNVMNLFFSFFIRILFRKKFSFDVYEMTAIFNLRDGKHSVHSDYLSVCVCVCFQNDY